jgi:hypothetical protein
MVMRNQITRGVLNGVFALIILLTISFNGFSQSCLPEGIVFHYQSEIDNFQTNYPGCTEIEGNYLLPDLVGLNNVSKIKGSLRIIHNGDLSSLTGLEGITSIDRYLEIQQNYFLVSLAGLENLTSIGSDLRIGTGFGGNHRLTSLAGLANLQSIGGNLWILDNLSLTDLTGLDSLFSIGGSLEVEENTSLMSLNGISNIAAGTITDIQIINNDTLATCDVQSICDYLASPNGTVEIHDNFTGCNSPEEVEAECGVGVEESAVGSRQSAVNIYPNPATLTITIELPSAIPVKNTTLVIDNMEAKQVISRRVTEKITTISLAALPCGLYIVRLITADTVLADKFVKQ